MKKTIGMAYELGEKRLKDNTYFNIFNTVLLFEKILLISNSQVVIF